MKSLFISLLTLLAAVSCTASEKSLQTDTIEIPSSRLAYPMKVSVVVPEQALSDAESGTRFPTLYLLHGYSGDYRNWVRQGGNLDSLATAHGMIIVCPDGRDSWYWDSPLDPKMQMESFITQELVAAIDSLYPTLPSPEYRAITGLSMGGQGAMFLAIRHPEIFSAAGSMSGGLDIRPFPKNWKMKNFIGTIEENPQEWEWRTIYNLIDSLQPNSLDIIFDCGVDDIFHVVNANLHRKMVDKKIPHDYISRPGNHNWKYWRNSLPYQMKFFKDKFDSRKK